MAAWVKGGTVGRCARVVAVSVLLVGAYVPVPAEGAVAPVPRLLAHVTCPTATRCFAVGNAQARPSYKARSLVERWDGSSWSIMPSPNGSAPNTFLVGIACVSATSCIAVGQTRVNQRDGRSFALKMTGNTWSTVPIPAGGPGAQLVAVACAAATNCFAVGEYIDGANRRPLAMRWNGSRWTQVDAALPLDLAAAYLRAVVCTSGNCFALGGTADRRNPNAAIIERWNGTRFVIDQQFEPAGGVSPQFLDVTCPTPSRCRAVGDDGAASGGTFAATWTGIRWSLESTQNRGAVNSSLSGISCWTTSDCLAVGHSHDGRSGIQQTLTELRRGLKWSIVPSPNEDPRSSYLLGVDCIGAARCFAVGASTQPATTVILQWDGTSWRDAKAL